MKDELKPILEDIKKSLSDSNFSVFPSEDLEFLWSNHNDEDEDADEKCVFWDSGHGNWKDFLATAKQINVPLIYLQIKQFSYENCLASINRLDGEIEEDEVKNRIKQAQEFKSRDESIEQLLIAFQREKIWHVFSQAADWQSDYLDLVSIEITDEDDEEYDDELSEKEIEKFAREIASDASFDGTKSKKEMLAHKLKKKYLDKQFEIANNWRDIFNEALVIYDSEIRPTKEKQIADKARKLQEQGKSNRAIASQLGITERALGEILNRQAS